MAQFEDGFLDEQNLFLLLVGLRKHLSLLGQPRVLLELPLRGDCAADGVLEQQDLLLLEELLVQGLQHVGRAVVLQVQLELHYRLLVPVPHVFDLLDDLGLGGEKALLQPAVALLVDLDQPREAVMCVILLLDEVRDDLVAGALHDVDFPVDQSAHGLDVLLDLVVTAVDRGHAVEFVLDTPENAVGAEQFLLRLAVDRNVAVVLQAPDRVFGAD